MSDRPLDCLADSTADTLPIHAVRPAELASLLDRLPEAAARYVRQSGFAAGPAELLLVPGEQGIAASLLGLGGEPALHGFGALAFGLPENTDWRIEGGSFDRAEAVLGFCLGAYRFDRYRTARRRPARLLPPDGTEAALSAATASWMVRDLINTPANDLGPTELAEAAAALARRHGASATIMQGDALSENYPALAAVAAGSARAPRVARLEWRGSGAHADSPLISLCGKGVCFDSGGYDLKPSSGMLRMKKDMGGAATVLGVARMVMASDLPVRLAVRIGCVENSVSGTAMRPMDVLRTRRGLSVEVGNTDAEGRLVLCDLLAEAADENPTLLIDCATLTGAARVALGPDLPALFCSDDSWAAALIEAGAAVHDPLWRLPLWDGYAGWLNSGVADLNNVSGKPHAGAVIAALFLRRFVPDSVAWAHFDIYAWNDQARPGRPEGGEAQAMRAIHAAIERRFRTEPKRTGNVIAKTLE